MPPEAAKLIGDQMTTVASANSGSLSLGLVLSIATALWSASSGMKALIEGVNIAYDEPETRGFLKLRGLALLLTIGGIVVFCLAIGAIAVFPALANKLPGGEVLETDRRGAALGGPRGRDHRRAGRDLPALTLTGISHG